jgi:hypothetical protein
LWDRQALCLEAVEMKRHRALHLSLDFVARTPGGNATGKVRRVCGEASAGLLDYDQVLHGFNPACLRILFNVPGATSSPGLPATVTSPGLFACLNCRCEPRCRTTDQPSSSSILTTSRIFTTRATLESQWVDQRLATHAAPWPSLSHDMPSCTNRETMLPLIPSVTTHRRLGGHRFGHTDFQTLQTIRKSALFALSRACLGRRGSLVRIQSPPPLSEFGVPRIGRRRLSSGGLPLPVFAGLRTTGLAARRAETQRLQLCPALCRGRSLNN